MKNKITIKVTKKDIKYGQPKLPETCAVALAIKRHYKVDKVVVTTLAAILYVNEIEIARYKLSKKINKFIHKFDTGKKVDKAEFTLTKSIK